MNPVARWRRGGRMMMIDRSPELHRSPRTDSAKTNSAKTSGRRPERVALLMIDVAGSALAPMDKEEGRASPTRLVFDAARWR